mgnify:CR=1 FL=1
MRSKIYFYEDNVPFQYVQYVRVPPDARFHRVIAGPRGNPRHLALSVAGGARDGAIKSIRID